MKRRQPQASVMVEVPDCRMRGSTTLEGKILINLGWPEETAVLLFKRRALRRFVRLATDLLADLPAHESESDRGDHVSSPS